MNYDERLKPCQSGSSKRKHEKLKDVDSSELYSEMCHLKQVHHANIYAKGSVIKPLDRLNRLSKLKLSGLFTNISVALRIFLTLPVTVATAERSFSKPLPVARMYLGSILIYSLYGFTASSWFIEGFFRLLYFLVCFVLFPM